MRLGAVESARGAYAAAIGGRIALLESARALMAVLSAGPMVNKTMLEEEMWWEVERAEKTFSESGGDE